MNGKYGERGASTKKTQRRELRMRKGWRVEDGEIVNNGFLDEKWYQELKEAIVEMVKKHPFCTVRFLKSKFAQIDEHYLATALSDVSGQLEEVGILPTRYKVREQVITVNHRKWRWADNTILPSQRKLFPDAEIYARKK